MALQGGYRFPVPFGEAFPYGVYAMSVEQAQDYDEKSGRRSPSRDKQNDNQWVFTVVGIDRDPEARQKEIKVKVTAAVQPVLPEEILPGSGLHDVEFEGLTVTPYLDDKSKRLKHSYRATGVRAARAGAKSTPTGPGSTSSSSLSSKSAGSSGQAA